MTRTFGGGAADEGAAAGGCDEGGVGAEDRLLSGSVGGAAPFEQEDSDTATSAAATATRAKPDISTATLHPEVGLTIPHTEALAGSDARERGFRRSPVGGVVPHCAGSVTAAGSAGMSSLWAVMNTNDTIRATANRTAPPKKATW